MYYRLFGKTLSYHILTGVLAVGVLFSCKDKDAEPKVQGGGKTSTVALDLEINLEGGTRGLPLYIVEGAKDMLPRPFLEDGDEVPVHTALCSSDGILEVKTLRWKYIEDTQTLRLTTDTENLDANSISIVNEDNLFDDPDRKWYVSGIIGGVMQGRKVYIEPTRELRGANVGDQVNLEVPYAFPWMELKTSKREFTTLVAHAEGKDKVMFKPLGSVIGYRFANEITKSFPSQQTTPSEEKTFTMRGFQVWSSLYTDQGAFTFSTRPTVSTLPIWHAEGEGTCFPIMEYSLKQVEELPIVGDTKLPQDYSKTYYAWVMKRPQAVSYHLPLKTRVLVRGAVRGASDWHHDYTNLYFTDYEPKVNTQVKDHTVHHLASSITKRVPLPIEYLTEYNLQGGEGLVDIPTEVANQGNFSPNSRYTGSLRFAETHDNDASGYYNWFVASGTSDPVLNPNAKDLSRERISVKLVPQSGGGCLDIPVLGDRYRIPHIEDWWSVFPGSKTTAIGFYENLPHPNPRSVEEFMTTGEGASNPDVLRQIYISRYSQPVISSNKNIVYALRFGKHPHCQTATSVEGQMYLHTPAPDNTLLCAYRYTLLGEDVCWSKKGSKHTGLKIDVVYLGNAMADMTLEQLAAQDERFWTGPTSIHRMLPAAGGLRSLLNAQNTDREISELEPGLAGYYLSLSNYEVISGKRAYRCGTYTRLNVPQKHVEMYYATDIGVRERSVAIRLFKRDEDLNGRKREEWCSDATP
ncbi:MAG: hypothetical protein Q4A61_06455 [Porphyromonadaceae bacterium]|nr:hypothetical protein [Porphyromonadaceae bacterium]